MIVENQTGQEDIIIEVEGEDGLMHRCHLVETIQYKNKQYAIFQDMEASIDNRGMITAFEMIDDGDSYGLLPLEDIAVIDAIFQEFCVGRVEERQQETAYKQENVTTCHEEEKGSATFSVGDILELSESDGSITEAKIILSFDFKEKNYLALLPVGKENVTATQYSIYELIQDGEAQRLVPIQRDARGFAVWSRFRRLIDQTDSAANVDNI